jgi:hypothetical protein
MKLSVRIQRKRCLLRSDAFMNEAIGFIKSITQGEILYIASADYGMDVEKHKSALQTLIFEQDGIITQDQNWYPYEVIELRRWRCELSHEREFAICNLIIALSIINGADSCNSTEDMLDSIANEYDKLPNDLRDLVVNYLLKAADD